MRLFLPEDPLLDTLRMKQSLAGVADQRGKIARMMEDGDLFQLRRGLYATRRELDPLALAGSIYGPSYLSFETALSWHRLIPESVTAILSATPRRTADFTNDFARFEYLTVPMAVFPVGIERVADGELPFLIASPTKALADRIAREKGFRSMVDVRRWLEGMRIDTSLTLDRSQLTECAAAYRRPSVRLLLRFAEKQNLFTR